jgi:hypothetical protein
MSTALGFDVDHLVISLTGYYLDNATRAMVGRCRLILSKPELKALGFNA